MPYPGINDHSLGYLTIEKVAADVQFELDDYDSRTLLRIKQFIIRGMNELKMFHTRAPKEKYITIPDSLLVDLPDDFIDYKEVSFKNGQGQMVVLGRNKHLPPLRPDSIGSVVDNEAEIGEYSGGYPGFGQYGMVGGQAPSYFNIDYVNRVLYLNRQVYNAEICLKYISSGIFIDGETQFSSAYREALVAYAVWKLSTAKTINERLMYERRYHDEVHKLRAFEGSFTEQEFRDVMAGTKKQAP